MPNFTEWKARIRRQAKPHPKFQPHDVYSATPLTPNTTRVIRLLPQREPTTTQIKCELFTYNLSGKQSGERHLYEAVSYVWGTGPRCHSITLNNCAFPVTENLHAALWHLRDRQLERVLWVDAVCINQDDNKEKERQIPLMRTIYAQAGRVIVWLGLPLDGHGDQALGSIRQAGGEGLTVMEDDYTSVMVLLRRDWFRRMWILQEVGVARSVVVMCGSVQIDGHAFCQGLAGMDHLLPVDLHPIIHPVVQLIRGAPYRPKYQLHSRGVFSMGELLDMYRSCRATLQHDKIYALLGLSLDGLDAPALQPDYSLPWHEVFQRATAHIFGASCTVKTWPESHTAVITGKCLFLGQITSVDQDNNHGDGQVHVWVHCTTAAQSLGYGEHGWDWAFPPFSESVREGDIVCHLQGAARPSIVRLCQDHFTVIKTSAPSASPGEPDRQSNPSEDHLSNIALTFTIPPGSSNNSYYDEAEQSTELLTITPSYHEDPSTETKRLHDTAALLEDRFVRSLHYNGNMSPALQHLISQCSPKVPISEQLLQSVVSCPTGEPIQIMQLLFQKRGDKLPITESIVRAAAANSRLGYPILQLLFQKRGESLPVSEQVVVAAAGNTDKGCQIMSLLFEQRGWGLVISEEAVVAAAGNYWSGHQILRLFFEQRGDNLPISERVVETAAGNTRCGYETVKVLLQQRKSLQISDGVVTEAAGNPRHGHDIMRFLFARDKDLAISENVVKAAAENGGNGYEIMLLLLEKRGKRLPISDEVVKAAQANSLYGHDIMQLLASAQSA
ncbi:hypothetical protein QC763_402140 [Podospora pseudopauciseta]|uniref:Heterokaryon incompatibility domain-containing protein n=1 Tax=Podospora pseudopauciseta TaxID=2093780 RepID=A0ABR0HBN7_9PEZI|nr:hypothetical protein QC763_402140 [Podospora pseudopauciseta]